MSRCECIQCGYDLTSLVAASDQMVTCPKCGAVQVPDTTSDVVPPEVLKRRRRFLLEGCRVSMYPAAASMVMIPIAMVYGGQRLHGVWADVYGVATTVDVAALVLAVFYPIVRAVTARKQKIGVKGTGEAIEIVALSIGINVIGVIVINLVLTLVFKNMLRGI